MSLQIASGLLRRLQDTIYASAPRDVREVQFATHGPVDDPTAMAGTEPDAGSADSALVLADPTSSTQEVTSQDIPAPTSPTFDNFATRSVHDTSARRRQASIPMLVTPDTNAQTELRKRILEIQTLALPEREKSRRIQV
jgi:hypothetical protein